jgi:uncharacterized protein
MIYSILLDMSRKVGSPTAVDNKKEIAVNNGHIAALQLKHAELEAKLEIENARPFPDDDLIHLIKKKKLAIKDQILQDAVAA